MTTQPLSLHPTIRNLTAADCGPISDAFTRQGWHKPVEQYQKYYQESLEGKRVVLVAEIGGDFAGYLNVVWESSYAPFRLAGIPEIADFNVLKKYQRRHIGSVLMDAAERLIAARSSTAGIGVGLLPDYGPAQVLYVKRGYIPDGRGILSHGKTVAYGDTVPVDDDLVLYLTRVLGI